MLATVSPLLKSYCSYFKAQTGPTIQTAKNIGCHVSFTKTQVAIRILPSCFLAGSENSFHLQLIFGAVSPNRIVVIF